MFIGSGLNFNGCGMQSVKLACAKVVKALDPILREAEKGASWRDIIAAAQGDADGFTPTKVPTRQPSTGSGGRSAGQPPRVQRVLGMHCFLCRRPSACFSAGAHH